MDFSALGRGRGPLAALMLVLTLAGCSNATQEQDAASNVENVVAASLGEAANTAAARRADELLRDPGTPIIGNPAGSITIVEFFDYQCPYCKAAEPRLRDLVAKDPDVRVVIKDFPILTPVSRVAARAALASREQGKHAPFHHAMMDHRGTLTEADIFGIAESVGLDVPRLKQDMDSPKVADQLISNFNLARAMKISLVPGFVVEDRVLSGFSSKTETSKIDFAAEVQAQRTRRSAS